MGKTGFTKFDERTNLKDINIENEIKRIMKEEDKKEIKGYANIFGTPQNCGL